MSLFEADYPTMKRSAIISPDGHYRFWLERRWAPGPNVCWIMLNPSTADASIDDPTIRRCIALTKREGYGAMVVVNLFAWRATKPSELATIADPIGGANHSILIDEALSAALVIAAWGAHPMARNVASATRGALRDEGIKLYRLGSLTKGGCPRHPLDRSGQLRSDTPLEVWP